MANTLALLEGDYCTCLKTLYDMFSLQLTEGLLGQATVNFLLGDMILAKKYMVRAREIATETLGTRHHYVAAIINQVILITISYLIHLKTQMQSV